MRSSRWFVLVVLVSVVGCTSSQAQDPFTGVRAVSEPLPILSGKDLQGKQLSTQDLAGRILVINAWATWCTPCEREQPALVEVANRYADRGVAFLGINHADQDAKASDWIQHYHVPYPSLSDPAGHFAATLGYIGLPDTYVVDATGTIRYVIAGATSVDQLSGFLDEMLAAQTRASSATATNSPAK